MKEQLIVEVSIHSDEDVIAARQKVRALSQEIGFNPLDQTRVVTAVSELARNIVVHAQKGQVLIYKIADRPGIKIVFTDQGPGIPDIQKALAK